MRVVLPQPLLYSMLLVVCTVGFYGDLTLLYTAYYCAYSGVCGWYYYYSGSERCGLDRIGWIIHTSPTRETTDGDLYYYLSHPIYQIDNGSYILSIPNLLRKLYKICSNVYMSYPVRGYIRIVLLLLYVLRIKGKERSDL